MRFKANVSAGMGESSLASSSSNPEERRPRLRPPHPANNSMKVCMTVQYREVSEKSPGGELLDRDSDAEGRSGCKDKLLSI